MDYKIIDIEGVGDVYAETNRLWITRLSTSKE